MVLAARQKGMKQRPKLTCTNCSKTGHSIEKCWEKGGGSEGKALDWYKLVKDKQKEPGKSKKKEHANAAVDDSSSSSTSESCAILHDNLSTYLASARNPSSRETSLEILWLQPHHTSHISLILAQPVTAHHTGKTS